MSATQSPQTVGKSSKLSLPAFSRLLLKNNGVSKKARFKVTQSGTSAPVVTVIENGFGGIPVFARTGTGVYTATLVGAFTANKTLLTTKILTAAGANVEGVRTSADVVTFTTKSTIGGSAADGLLTDALIEIEVLN